MNAPIVCVNGDIEDLISNTNQQQITTISCQMLNLAERISAVKDDTNHKVELMENQGWFKRMIYTITGKNKATKNDIIKNQNTIISYISQAVALLYQKNQIDERILCSLGNRINQVYSKVTENYVEQLRMKNQIDEILITQDQILNSLSETARNLNEKIESVDNYHILIKEIEQDKYNDNSIIFKLCSILANLDHRMMKDERKLDVLKNTIFSKQHDDNSKITIKQLLYEVSELSEDKLGIVYLELGNYSNAFPANVIIDMIEEYHFLNETEKISKSKDLLIKSILDKSAIDGESEIPYSKIYDAMINNKKDNCISTEQLQLSDEEFQIVKSGINSKISCDSISESYDPDYKIIGNTSQNILNGGISALYNNAPFYAALNEHNLCVDDDIEYYISRLGVHDLFSTKQGKGDRLFLDIIFNCGHELFLAINKVYLTPKYYFIFSESRNILYKVERETRNILDSYALNGADNFTIDEGCLFYISTEKIIPPSIHNEIIKMKLIKKQLSTLSVVESEIEFNLNEEILHPTYYKGRIYYILYDGRRTLFCSVDSSFDKRTSITFDLSKIFLPQFFAVNTILPILGYKNEYSFVISRSWIFMIINKYSLFRLLLNNDGEIINAEFIAKVSSSNISLLEYDNGDIEVNYYSENSVFTYIKYDSDGNRL